MYIIKNKAIPISGFNEYDYMYSHLGIYLSPKVWDGKKLAKLVKIDSKLLLYIYENDSIIKLKYWQKIKLEKIN